jgi:sodium-coupled neutral amino acid transporter 9
VHIDLFGLGFFQLIGMLSLSYFIHNAIVIIMKNNKIKENNKRDLCLGYVAVGTSYLTIGVLGYFGFRGNGFATGSISQVISI